MTLQSDAGNPRGGSRLDRGQFVSSGMTEVRPHVLTKAEAEVVRKAISALPALHQEVLLRQLHSLSFVDGIPGNGTGLTSKRDGGDSYDITLRASVIEQSLSDFLTVKEQRVFLKEDQPLVVLHAHGANALTYVLLHEATHVGRRDT